jgi:hypothetical protein
MQQSYTLTTVTGATEVLITPGQARLIAIIPQGTATGTVTVREANAIGSDAAARWTAPTTGTTFGGGDAGVAFAGGLTVQLSVGGDTFGIVWGPRL